MQKIEKVLLRSWSSSRLHNEVKKVINNLPQYSELINVSFSVNIYMMPYAVIVFKTK